MHLASRRLGALLLLPALILGLSACGSDGGSTKGSPSNSSGGSASNSGAPEPESTQQPVQGDAGITVAGAFGTAPEITIPSGSAPGALSEKVLTEGTGPALASGDTLVGNYVGETWAPKDGKPNVFDSSFARQQPAAFVVGKRAVISGWDKILVGKKVGSRVLLVIPAADGYGKDGRPEAGIAGGDTLIFVVDILAGFAPDASAPGTAVTDLPAGLPKLENTAGAEPKILDVAGVTAPAEPSSTLLVRGSGEPIDAQKSLVLQMVQTDVATGKKTQATWGNGPQLVAAQQLLGIVDAFQGQSVGSRAIALLPASPQSGASEASILIIDVVGQV